MSYAGILFSERVTQVAVPLKNGIRFITLTYADDFAWYDNASVFHRVQDLYQTLGKEDIFIASAVAAMPAFVYPIARRHLQQCCARFDLSLQRVVPITTAVSLYEGYKRISEATDRKVMLCWQAHRTRISWSIFCLMPIEAEMMIEVLQPATVCDVNKLAPIFCAIASQNMPIDCILEIVPDTGSANSPLRQQLNRDYSNTDYVLCDIKNATVGALIQCSVLQGYVRNILLVDALQWQYGIAIDKGMIPLNSDLIRKMQLNRRVSRQMPTQRIQQQHLSVTSIFSGRMRLTVAWFNDIMLLPCRSSLLLRIKRAKSNIRLIAVDHNKQIIAKRQIRLPVMRSRLSHHILKIDFHMDCNQAECVNITRLPAKNAIECRVLHAADDWTKQSYGQEIPTSLPVKTGDVIDEFSLPQEKKIIKMDLLSHEEIEELLVGSTTCDNSAIANSLTYKSGIT